MTDAFRHETPRSRARGALVALAVLIAFAAGLGVAWWGTRWAATHRSATPAPVALTRPTAAAPAPAPTPVAAVDPAQVAARADLLSARLATIEQRTAMTERDAAAAAGQAGRAEALLLAAAARRA